MTLRRLVNAISAHSWSPDEATLALCPNNSEIHLYRASEHGTLKKQCILREHSQVVSAIDWNRDGSFASCSHDSSAYYWRRDGDAWKPELVDPLAANLTDYSVARRTLAVLACNVLCAWYTTPSCHIGSHPDCIGPIR